MKILLLSIFSLTFSLQNKAQTKATATTLIADATKQAAKENKKVFIRYTASWCGWCHRMNAAMKDNSTVDLFNKNFIVVPIVVMEHNNKKELETPGGDSAILAHGGAQSGLPYWVVLDTNGKLIANSKEKAGDKPLTDSGENVGCPAQPNEVKYFLRILKATTSLTDIELKIIEKRFNKINTE